MAMQIIGRQQKWSLQRKSDASREYRIAWLLKGDLGCGPYEALNTPGLPLPGSTWNFDNDRDDWAFCRQDAQLTMYQHNPDRDGPWKYWLFEQTFSTNVFDSGCEDQQVENPLLQKPNVSGTFIQEFKEATHDVFTGKPLKNSSHEQLRGNQVEFPWARPTVHIEKNTPSLNLPLLTNLINRVNSSPMWGCDKRCVLLSSVSWSKQYYGQCFSYYRWALDFEVNFNTFDRIVLDEGTKVLYGEWHEATGKYVIKPILKWNPGHTIAEEITPDPENPQHFKRFQDRDGNPSRVILNGHGLPSETIVVHLGGDPNEEDEDPGPDSPDPGKIKIKGLLEGNMFQLGIPAVL